MDERIKKKGLTKLVWDSNLRRWHPIPGWESGSRIRALKKEVQRRRKRGERITLGHVIPIQSKYVCGLHCADNLVIECERLNYSKGNRWWEGWNEQLVLIFETQLELF